MHHKNSGEKYSRSGVVEPEGPMMDTDNMKRLSGTKNLEAVSPARVSQTETFLLAPFPPLRTLL